MVKPYQAVKDQYIGIRIRIPCFLLCFFYITLEFFSFLILVCNGLPHMIEMSLYSQLLLFFSSKVTTIDNVFNFYLFLKYCFLSFIFQKCCSLDYSNLEDDIGRALAFAVFKGRREWLPESQSHFEVFPVHKVMEAFPNPTLQKKLNFPCYFFISTQFSLFCIFNK